MIGDPDPSRICTSIVERSNLSIRTSVRRLTRLTNAFSKKWENLKAMLALYFAYYNFCRVHSSIPCTPAMESGLKPLLDSEGITCRVGDSMREQIKSEGTRISATKLPHYRLVESVDPTKTTL